jgi:hypothetical protein
MSVRMTSPRRRLWLGDRDFEIHDRPFNPHPYDEEFDGPPASPWVYETWETNGEPVNLGATGWINPYDAFVAGGLRIAFEGDPFSTNFGPNGLIRDSWIRGQMPRYDASSFWRIRRPISFDDLGQDFFVYARMSTTINSTQSQVDNAEVVGLGLFGAPGGFVNSAFAQIVDTDLNEVSVECGVFENNVFTLIGSEGNNLGGAGTVRGQSFHTAGIQVTGRTGINMWLLSAAGNWTWVGSTSYTGGIESVALFGANGHAVANSIQGFDYVRFVRGRCLP